MPPLKESEIIELAGLARAKGEPWICAVRNYPTWDFIVRIYAAPTSAALI